MFATSVLCGPLVTFTPVLVSEAFHGDAGEFSAAVAAFGVGGLLGAPGCSRFPPSRIGVDGVRASRSATASRWRSVALDPWFWGVPALLVLAGAAMTVSNTSANSLLQATASPHLLGRTVSLFMLAMRGGISLGALSTGLSIETLGVRHALLANGAWRSSLSSPSGAHGCGRPFPNPRPPRRAPRREAPGRDMAGG